MAEFAVADVRLGQLDSTGAQIDTVYYKSGNNYAIFRTTERVVIQYADKPERADEQRSRFARLNLVRGEINGLIDGWRKGDAIQQSKAKLFDRRVADALEYAFESNPDGALVTLNAIKADVLAERTAVARSQYIVVSAVAVLVLAAITCYFASPFSWVAPFFKPFWAAAGFGGMGALFSIAIGIHDRSMGTDLQARQNAIDATLRVLIGALSAFILYLLLRTNIVSLKIGDADKEHLLTHRQLRRMSGSGKGSDMSGNTAVCRNRPHLPRWICRTLGGRHAEPPCRYGFREPVGGRSP
jgi:hypothetical protein